MKKHLAALGGICVLGVAAAAAPSAVAATAVSSPATTRLAAPQVNPQFGLRCHKALYLNSSEPTFHAALTDDALRRPGVSIQFRLTRVAGGEPRRANVAIGTVDTHSANAANWTPDYGRVGDLEDGAFAIAVRTVLTPDDGGPVTTSGWSVPTRFTIATATPATPTVTMNADGSLNLTSPGATGFLWSFGRPLVTFTGGQEICVTSQDSNGGTILANHGRARLATDMTGPMFFTVAAYGPSGQVSGVSNQVIGFPGS